MPASIKVVSVFAVALTATVSGYFLLIPDAPPERVPGVPVEPSRAVQSPAAEKMQHQQQANRAADRERSRDRERQNPSPSGLIAESVRQAEAKSQPSLLPTGDEVQEGDPLWKRMAHSDSTTLTSGKGDMDFFVPQDEFVGPLLIVSEQPAPIPDDELDTPLAQRDETELSEPTMLSPPVAVTETVIPLPSRVVTPEIHVVKQGDTYQSIAEEWFGDETKWGLVAEANPQVDARRMQVGQRIVLPPRNTTSRVDRGRSIDKTNTYVVQPGDTLTRIAIQLWGDPSKWNELYEANRSTIGASPDTLQVGMKLTVPVVGHP